MKGIYEKPKYLVLAILSVFIFAISPAAVVFIMLGTLMPTVILAYNHDCNTANSPYKHVPSFTAVFLSPVFIIIAHLIFFGLIWDRASAVSNLSTFMVSWGVAFHSASKIAEFAAYLSPTIIYAVMSSYFYMVERLYYDIPLRLFMPMPEILINCQIAFIILSVLFYGFKAGAAALNCVLCLMMLYFYRGLDIIRFYMDGRVILMLQRILIYILIYLFFIPFVAVLGLKASVRIEYRRKATG